MTSSRIATDWNWIRQHLTTPRLSLLCGAGISRQAGLPVVTELVSELLNHIEAPQSLHDRVFEMPFELFVAVLRRHSDIMPLLAMFNTGLPNTNHRLLAHLIRRQIVFDICTTNFDVLIERAYSECAGNSDLAVLSTAPELDGEVWTVRRPRLTKIHGCSTNLQDMAITINQVAGKVYSRPRAAAIEHIFATGDHDVVLVLGYSCSDTFDISPQLATIGKRGKPVYIVEHVVGIGDRIEIEPIANRLGKNPFSDYEKSYRIFADTDQVIRFLWDEMIPDHAYSPPETCHIAWRTSVEAWAKTVSRPHRHLIRGHLMMLLGMSNESLGEFGAGAAWEPSLIGNQVPLLLARGEGERAEEVCRRSVELLRVRNPGSSELGNQIGWHGCCFVEMNRPDDALPHFYEALRILEAAGDRQGVGNQHGNLGNAFFLKRQHDRAMREYQLAMNIASEIGNEIGVVNQLIGMTLVSLDLGHPSQAFQYSLRGKKKALAIGRRDLLANLTSLSRQASQQLGIAEP